MNKIATQVMEKMSDIEYGFKDEFGINIINNLQKWESEFDDFYYLQTPEELLETKCGVCWDQVELERKLFSDNNINAKTYFIFLKEKDMLPSHTFLTFQNNNKYYWFEHSWGLYKGIHEYTDLDIMLKDIVSKFKESHKEISVNAKLFLYEYNTPPKHIKCNEFYKYIESQKRISNDF